MYTSKAPPKGGKGASGGGGDAPIPLYDFDELDILRDELLEAYTTPREHIITRDQLTEIRRTQFALKESQRLTLKKTQDEKIRLQIKAKQDALKRLYANVLQEKAEKQKKQHRSKKNFETNKSNSTGSFHKMYTIYHDPTSGVKATMIRGNDGDMDVVENKNQQSGPGKAQSPVKVLDAKTIASPSAKGESDKMTESSGKERSKFVLKQRFPSLKSKPPPLLEGVTKLRTSREMRHREDTRYSEDKDRFSFDVDVVGPLITYVDPHKRRPRMRTVATQAMMVDDVTRKSGDWLDMGSQTEFEVGSWGFSSKRTSKNTDRSRDSRQYEDMFYDGLEQEADEEQAAGDASSSNPSDIDEEEDTDREKGKSLVRKESKRREAETMARPRGYRDLDLGEPLPFVTFEAETTVTAHDLDREEAKLRGFALPKDNILWPTCAEFDIDSASKKIEDYIKRCWNLDPKWLFMIQPLEVYHDSYRKKYVFEVKFSIPSATVPVPPATASVFFVFEIPMYSTKDNEVKVSYVLEGTRFAHNPGKIPFQDKWLWGIISDKLRVQKAVNF